MKPEWKPDVDIYIHHDTVYIEPILDDFVGKTFVVNNAILYKIFHSKEKIPHSYYTLTKNENDKWHGYGYINNILFKWLDYDWPAGETHSFHYCRIESYQYPNEILIS